MRGPGKFLSCYGGGNLIAEKGTGNPGKYWDDEETKASDVSGGRGLVLCCGGGAAPKHWKLDSCVDPTLYGAETFVFCISLSDGMDRAAADRSDGYLLICRGGVFEKMTD